MTIELEFRQAGMSAPRSLDADLFSGLDASARSRSQGAQSYGESIPGGSRTEALPTCSSNPLLNAALRLLNLIPRLRATTVIEQPSELRLRLMAEIRLFEQQASAANVAREEIIGARYCLCTVIDETAAQTPWGSKGVWAEYSLLVTFHNETWGGEKYYQLLGRLAQYPERHRDLIELLYYCNALGFEGKFRIVENGHAQLEVLKRRIAALLNNVRNGYERRMSPHWEGVTSTAESWRMIPAWVIASLCALIAFGIYAWFVFQLGPRSDQVFARLAALEPPPPLVAGPLEESTPPPARLRRFLEAEIREGLLDVVDQTARSVVILRGDGLFDSGSADVRQRYLPVLARVARALDETDGSVVVTGYTDSVPMRGLRFPSNWHLSEARARAVGELLAQRLAQGGRVRAEGRGEANPVAGNDTAEGRARNRRVEITLLLSGSEIQRQINTPVTSLPGGAQQ